MSLGAASFLAGFAHFIAINLQKLPLENLQRLYRRFSQR
jgi:hypothetical protein